MRIMCVCCLFFFSSIERGKKKSLLVFMLLWAIQFTIRAFILPYQGQIIFCFASLLFFYQTTNAIKRRRGGGLVFIRERIIITSWRRRISRNDGYRFLVTMTTHVPAFFAFHPHLETHFFFFAFSLLFFKEGTKKMENRTSFTILFCFQKTSLLLLFSVRYIGRCRVRCLCVLSSGTVTWSHRLFTEKSHLLRTHRQEGEKAGLSRLARPTHGSQGRALLPSVKKKKDDLGRVKKFFFFLEIKK